MIYEKPHDVKIKEISEAINKNVAVANSPKYIRKQLFQLAREVKTIIGFHKPIEDEYKRVVRQWYMQSGKVLADESFDILWAQFKTSWDKIKYSTNGEVFWRLYDFAEFCEYPPICENYQDIAKDLIRFCAVLDSNWTPEPFYLACRMAGDEFGCSHTNMATLLESLVMDGVLELVEKGKFIGKEGRTGRASRYKFLADKGKIDVSLVRAYSECNLEV